MKTNYKDVKESIYKYRKTKKWLLAHLYNNQIWNSKRRWHNPPNYTLDELRVRYIDDNIFNEIYNKWVDNWYNINLTPSLDRINPLLWYSLDNIQIVTLKDNLEKWHKERNITQWKRIIQKKDWLIINKFLSITDAWKETWIDFRIISNVLHWRNKTARWFTFEFI